MIAIISGVIQIIFLILKNKFESDADEKKRKEKIHANWTDAVKSGDISRINSIIDKLHK